MAQDKQPRGSPQGGTGKQPAGKPSSQGLTGAQGSGGGADRGIQQPPPRRRVGTDQSSSNRDNSGINPEGSGADVSD